MMAPKICAVIYLDGSLMWVEPFLGRSSAVEHLPNCFQLWEPFENNEGYCKTRTEVSARGRETDREGQNDAACVTQTDL